MNQKVTDYLESISQSWQVDVCARLRELLTGLPGVSEDYKWNSPFYLVGTTQFASYGAFAKHVRLNIFNASGLAAPEGLFDPSSTDERRAVLIRAGDDVDYGTLGTLLGEHARALR
jgi:hypothetical protein